MRDEDFELLYKLEETYWWFVAMRTITDSIAGDKLHAAGALILDAGCGTGFNVQYYGSRNGRKVYAIDIVKEALDRVRDRGFSTLAQASVSQIPFASATFDLVFSFDVLQQLSTDLHEDAIREMYRVLKPGGRLFVRAAAFEWLRSSHDEDMSSFHRFTLPELETKLIRSGFKLLWSSYANGFLFPVVVMRRFLKRFGIGGGTDVRPFPTGLRWVEGIFENILAGEARWFESGRRLPFGASVICYAEKQGFALEGEIQQTPRLG